MMETRPRLRRAEWDVRPEVGDAGSGCWERFEYLVKAVGSLDWGRYEWDLFDIRVRVVGRRFGHL